MVDALVSNTSDFTVMRVRVSPPAPKRFGYPRSAFFISFWRMAIFTTQDGSQSIFSEQYGVSYHSRFGAVTESAHVFINAGLRFKAAVQRNIHVLEAGFGTGLNALMTWFEAERRNLAVHYTGLEIFPVAAEAAAALQYAEALQAPGRAEDFFALHQCEWEVRHLFSEHFSFEKKATNIKHFELSEGFDLIYFDAFAPQTQPELWSETVFAQCYRSLKSDGILVTYCAKGDVKRTLKQVGFVVETLQGPPGKREMVRAIKINGEW